jgi:hypothetical protein
MDIQGHADPGTASPLGYSVITYLPPLFLFLQQNNYGDEMRAVGLSAQLQMPTFIPHHLLCCLLKSCSGPAPLSNLPARTSQGMASPFFKPLFQIVLDPPIRDMVKCNGKSLFSRGVSYVLAPYL